MRQHDPLNTGTIIKTARDIRSSNDNLHVLHCYSGNLYGGVEQTLVTLARYGDVTPAVLREFALVFPGRLYDELRREGAAVSVFGPARVVRPWTILNVRRGFSAFLKRIRPDLVVCHSCWPHAIFAPTVRRSGLPLAFWAHDVPTGRHWIERLAQRTPPDMIFVNSEFTATSLELLFPNIPYAVTRAPVRPPAAENALSSSRRRVRRELVTDDRAVVIVISARLEPYKGHSLLFESLARLIDVPDWVLWVIGGVQKQGEQQFLNDLTGLAVTSGLLDRIRFVGQREDVPRLLSAADIHCQPNLRGEPFGIAFVEALYAGLPVVTTRLGGALEIVDDSCGVLTSPGDAAALAGALRRLIVEPVRRRALSLNGPSRAADLCHPSRAMQRIAAVYAQAVNHSLAVEPAQSDLQS